jgi:hypothetical protein
MENPILTLPQPLMRYEVRSKTCVPWYAPPSQMTKKSNMKPTNCRKLNQNKEQIVNMNVSIPIQRNQTKTTKENKFIQKAHNSIEERTQRTPKDEQTPMRVNPSTALLTLNLKLPDEKPFSFAFTLLREDGIPTQHHQSGRHNVAEVFFGEP